MFNVNEKREYSHKNSNCNIVTSSGSYLKCGNLRRFTLNAIPSLSSLPLQATLGLESSVSSAASVYQCLFNCRRSFSALSWMQRHMRETRARVQSMQRIVCECDEIRNRLCIDVKICKSTLFEQVN